MSTPAPDSAPRPSFTRRDIAAAGHTGDAKTARAGLSDADATVRATAVGALQRLGALSHDDVRSALLDTDVSVRVRATEAAARMPDIDLIDVLSDTAWQVVEMACWSVGEHEHAGEATFAKIVALAGGHSEPLVREAAVAALGAIGDAAAVPTIVAATHDKPAVRRRAAVALAPFEEPEAIDALRRLLDDRDWQTRQVAEDLLDER